MYCSFTQNHSVSSHWSWMRVIALTESLTWHHLPTNPTLSHPIPSHPILFHPNLPCSLDRFQWLCISFSPSSWLGSSAPKELCIYWNTLLSSSVKDNARAYPYLLVASYLLLPCASHLLFLCASHHIALSAPLCRIALWLLWPLCWKEVPMNLSPFR